ncbi:VWA domain-containing protein [Paenibacillus sp. WQ 127069]|uniref:VWA domain-containing protein n=1 Tax=Paenibacillus baimaensis TaxID=2982185 RepID=A0ABT2UT39_9BACL|nr:VWA domain-containing protein [Paenibacillus sp. WQ 127069]MCU6796839.1 VWA domain-containing protein [Paenibacillus sp. WQ 127069]
MTSHIQTTYAWNKEYWPTGGVERAYLLLEMKGNAGLNMERAPMNVSLVLDRSGSMSGAPLAYSKKACQFVTEQMSKQDQLSLVAFDDEVSTVFTPQSISHKDVMKQQIETIRSGGSTNLSGGLLQGIQYVVQGKKDGSINRVILLSDGHANEGITDRTKLQSIAREFQSAGIGITTMGVGNGFDEELMEGIADNGGGNFYFIEKSESIPDIFAKELDGLLSVVAQNVKLTINPSEITQILHIYVYKTESTQTGLKLSLGDVFDQETKSILIELSCHPHTSGKHEILQVQWDYVDVTEGAKVCKVQVSVEIVCTNDIELINLPANPHVDKQIKITESAVAIENAISAFDNGDEEAGKKLLQKQADSMLAYAVISDSVELREEAQMLYSHLEQFPYSSNTRKSLYEQKYRQMKRKK